MGVGTILFCVIFLSFQVLFKRNSYHSDFNSAITAIRSFEGSSYEYSSHYTDLDKCEYDCIFTA